MVFPNVVVAGVRNMNEHGPSTSWVKQTRKKRKKLAECTNQAVLHINLLLLASGIILVVYVMATPTLAYSLQTFSTEPLPFQLLN